MPGSRFAVLPTVQQAGQFIQLKGSLYYVLPQVVVSPCWRLQCGFHAGGNGYDALGREIVGEVSRAQALGECCFYHAECFCAIVANAEVYRVELKQLLGSQVRQVQRSPRRVVSQK